MLKKSIYITYILLIAVVITAVYIFASAVVKAAGTGDTDKIPESIWSIYQNHESVFLRDGMFYYQSRARKKSSDTYLRTIGLALSRDLTGITPIDSPYIKDKASQTSTDPHFYQTAGSKQPILWKNGLERQEILIDLDTIHKVTTVVRSGEYEITTWAFSKESVLALIRTQYPDWYAEILELAAADEPIYIGIDHIVAIHDGASDDWSGYIKDGVIRTNRISSGGYTYTTYTWVNQASLPDWAKRAGASSYYNNHLVLNDDDSDTWRDWPELYPESVITPEEVVAVTKNNKEISGNNETKNQSGDYYAAPDVTTYNTDDSNPEYFNIGEAIPTTEGYINYIDNDSWYGHFDVQKYEYKNTQEFNWSITYKWTSQVPMGTSRTNPGGGAYRVGSPNSAGEYEWVRDVTNISTVSTEEDGYEPVSASLTRTFYTVKELNLLQLVSTTTNNPANDRTNGEVVYNAAPDTSHVTYEIKINGETRMSGATRDYDTYFSESSWNASDLDNKAVHIDESGLSTIDHYIEILDIEASNDAEAYSKAIAEIQSNILAP